MELATLRQPPLSTTLLGCIKGASDYFHGDLSVPMLFGLSGHAFLINIHKDLCPSSPYVWKKDGFRTLLSGVGLDTVAEYELFKDASESERRRVESELKGHLDEGRLCMLDFLEHQLISGYNESGFLVLKPWNGMSPSEVPQITFGTWEPCLPTEGFAHLTVMAKASLQKPIEAAARDALRFGAQLQRDPSAMEEAGYRIGRGAYENWIACVERGMGDSHGHWWNGTVWSECRQQAAAFFQELSEVTESPVATKACAELQRLYADVAAALSAAREKSVDKARQLRLLRQASDAEGVAAPKMEALAGSLQRRDAVTPGAGASR